MTINELNLCLIKDDDDYVTDYVLFQIPENTEAYGVLLDKGIHPAFQNLQQVCPVKSAKLMRVLQKSVC